MSTITEQELVAFVLGDAPTDLQQRIELASRSDGLFAAKLSAIEEFKPLNMDDVPSVVHFDKRARRGRSRSARRMLAIALVVFGICGIGWAGYEIARTPPLFNDSFGHRTVEYDKWHPHLGRKGVSAEEGYLRLVNRGSVVTRREFNEPVEITFEWRWIDLGQWPLYSEILHVMLRTTGEHDLESPFEAKDGVCIGFNTVSNSVSVMAPGRKVLESTTGDAAHLPSGTWHRIRILDDGKQVSVFVEGPNVEAKSKKTPLLVVPIPDGLPGKRIGFHNREYVAGINHESHIDNIEVRRLDETRPAN
jgi:hypothetical protein